MSLPRRALISITSAHGTLFGGKETTGLFISEALHPYNVLRAAGFEVDLASESGAYTPDWLSSQPDFLHGEDLKIWNDTKSEFRTKLDNMPKAADLDGNAYGLFYASAGHAALIDYPTASSLQRIAAQVWKNGGVVCSVCHGPALFANLIDPTTNEPLVKNKRITGFTTEAEISMGIMDELRSWGAEMVEETATRLGAKYVRAPGIWDDFHVVDGRLVTGQNPASATSTAQAAVQVFDSA
ncbi:class I glutamine amidotransferase-like protein [Colletotrichum phormii]|uniref:D-lactate dehydratase n=1 Tax=Colletotrichum phormii TaxID=359342 RepID=A0AAI9ZHW5_9PEZI|nr:class I glutamine amidotransferase-like protein [Colletotrichum phormii]KAK1624553.1 class I glutamine amidotransferase-like protein [Colletotrichum phormii]